MSLTTFRKNGKAVPTPVWFVDVGDQLYVTTQAGTGKVKRIRNNGQVTLAPCTARGDILGDKVEAVASILPEADWPAAKKALVAKYGLQFRILSWLGRLRGQHQTRTFLTVSPV